MIRTGIAAALLAAAPAGAAEIACRADGAPADAVEMREAVLSFDANAFGGAAAPYAAVLVPADWRDEGAVAFDLNDPCGVIEKPRWRAVSPDGGSIIEVLAGEGWTASAHAAQFSACKARDLHDARGYVAALARAVAPEATLGDIRDRVDIVDPLSSQMKALEQLGARASATAAEVDYVGPDEAGGAEFGLVVAAVMTFTPAPSIPEYETRATAFPSFRARRQGQAPDAALVEAVRASALVDPNWLRYRERLMRPPGALPAPGERIAILPPEPFPAREAGEEVQSCGRRFSALNIPHIWRRDDGSYWFSPALRARLAAAE